MERLQQLEHLSCSRCYGITPQVRGQELCPGSELACMICELQSYLLVAACPALRFLNVFGVLRDLAEQELRQRLEGEHWAGLITHCLGLQVLRLTSSCSPPWPGRPWASSAPPSGTCEFGTSFTATATDDLD